MTVNELQERLDATETEIQINRLLLNVCAATCTCEAGCLEMIGHKGGCPYRILVFSIRRQISQWVGEDLYSVA